VNCSASALQYENQKLPETCSFVIEQENGVGWDEEDVHGAMDKVKLNSSMRLCIHFTIM
jgi:hypothetical protein